MQTCFLQQLANSYVTVKIIGANKPGKSISEVEEHRAGVGICFIDLF